MSFPEQSEVVRWFETLSNWGRWGSDDEAGTLNLITPERRVRATGLVRSGVTVSCSRLLAPRPSPYVGYEFTHRMNASGEGAPSQGAGHATDWFGLSFHGFDHTHLDAHSHLFWDGKMYNGRDARLCTTERGALVGGVESALGGISGRGLFVDGPALRGKQFLEPGEAIGPADLDDWLDRWSVETEPGDTLWVRTGRDAAIAAGADFDQGQGSPGIDPAALPWLREHDTAVLVSDVANDVRPSPYSEVPDPVHLVSIVAMGMWLVDNADMGELSRVAAEHERIEFFSMIVPLALRRSTGSPVNPIAHF